MENVLQENGGDPRCHTLDIIMLAMAGGRERTAACLSEPLTSCGFGEPRVIPTKRRLRIVEASAV